MRVNAAGRAIASLATLLAACASVPIPEHSAPQPPASVSVPTAPAPTLADVERSYRQRAAGLSQEGRWAEARALWEILLLLQPESNEYRLQLDQLQKRITEAVSERLSAAEKARQAGDLEQATMLYLRVLTVDPYNAAAARALRELESERVRRAYLSRPPRVAVATRPSAGNGARNSVAPSANDVSDLELAVMLFRQGDHAGSAQTLEKYLQTHPKDEGARRYLVDAYHQLGLAALQKGRKEDALTYLEK